jgi:hypothetical protein
VISELLNGRRGWYVGLTDRKEQCQQVLQAFSNDYTRLELKDISARNIEIGVFIDDR